MIGTNSADVFIPLNWQIPVWRDKARILLLDGPAGTGKSHLAAHKIDAYLRKYPGAMGLVVRKTRESMTNSTLIFLEHRVITSGARLRRQEKRFEYDNGSMLAYGGMKDDSQRESIRSIGLDGGLDIVWMEEAHLFSERDFEELLPRMRGRAASWRQIILTTNPDSDQHWIYQRLIKSGGAKRYVAKTADNVHNPDDYGDVLDSLTGVRRQRLRDGLWVTAEGVIYGDYRSEVHLIEPFAIPKDWRRIRSIDFGYNNPFVCQWWAIDGDGRMYLYRELYGTQKLVSDWAQEINRLSEGEHIEFTVADHDAEDRATLKREGISTMAAQKDVSLGIQRVQERMRVDETDKPAIFFMNDALVYEDEALRDQLKPVSTISEITSYVWQDGKKRDIPTKEDDHGMDAMRYAVMAVDKRKKARYVGKVWS